MTMPDNTTDDSMNPTPVQVLEAFYRSHSVGKVQLTLLEVLQGYALNENKGFLKLDIGQEQVALVFDDLIALVKAVQSLKEDGRIAGL